MECQNPKDPKMTAESDASADRRNACGHDDCEQPGFCDGRHCRAAGGAIRLTPKEQVAAEEARALGDALALVREPDARDPERLRSAVDLIEERLRRAGIAFAPLR